MALFRRHPPCSHHRRRFSNPRPPRPVRTIEGTGRRLPRTASYSELGPGPCGDAVEVLRRVQDHLLSRRHRGPGGGPGTDRCWAGSRSFLRIQGPNGDFAKFISEMALHWEIPGEGYLVGQDIDGDDEWDVWSPVEYDENRQGLRNDMDADAAQSIRKAISSCGRGGPTR